MQIIVNKLNKIQDKQATLLNTMNQCSKDLESLSRDVEKIVSQLHDKNIEVLSNAHTGLVAIHFQTGEMRPITLV